MIIVIPLGGIGSRFAAGGFTVPKALVPARGRPLISWLFDSVVRSSSCARIEHVIIPMHPALVTARFADWARHEYPALPLRFVELGGVTRGAVDTLRVALERAGHAGSTAPTLCLDGDNFYRDFDLISAWDGGFAIGCVDGMGPADHGACAFSHVLVDDEQRVTEIREKVRISNLACTGAYGFASANALYEACVDVCTHWESRNAGVSECYTSHLVARFVASGATVRALVVPSRSFVCLGTPLDVRIFGGQSSAAASHDKPLRICFDLDNTLVTFPRVRGDYSTVTPIAETITLARRLKELGHTIIIYTARRMRTHHANIGSVVRDIARVTIDTLDQLDIPYDELHFGKPYADHYVDDKAVPAFAPIMQRALGFYPDSIEPREFHQVQSCSIQAIKKHGGVGALAAEIAYYRDLPNSLCELFPRMLRYDSHDGSWLELERLNGVEASRLFVDNALTTGALHAIMDALALVHTATEQAVLPENASVYANYTPKLDARWRQFDYASCSAIAPSTYAMLATRLAEYERRNAADLVRLHGDPVFTNILLTHESRAVFIDPRGKLGDHITPLGDRVYDYAKVLQSLIGYDEILHDRAVDTAYRAQLLDAFWSRCPVDAADVRLVTASLLFTLVPLHRDKPEKAPRYLELAHTMLHE